jgi:glycosyltransferase involved in cell wall biosynthesis
MNFSVVIPIYNEEESVAPLCAELRPVLEKLGGDYEVLAVNDGSTDGTQAALEKEAAQWPQLQVIQLRKNFGQAAALSAGFDFSKGELVITLDGDLQNDPAYLPAFIGKLKEGWDVVCGWRQHRRGAWLTRILPSKIANWLIARLVDIPIHDTGCMLKIYRRSILQGVHLYGELHRFLPALCSWEGARVTEMPIEDRPRQHGVSKYGLSRTMKVFFDLLTIKFLLSYGTRPLQIFGRIGLLLLVPGFLLAAWLTYERLILSVSLAGRPALLLSALLMILGAQFFVIGLLAELITRSYHESTGRRIYTIRSRLTAGVKKES